MNSLPCPNCRKPLGIDLTFILKNPVSQCPYCKTVLDFSGNINIMEDYKKVLSEIELIKKQNKGITFS